MRMVQRSHGTMEWEVSWAELAPAMKAEPFSLTLTMALITGLSALLWGLLVAAIHWLVAI